MFVIPAPWKAEGEAVQSMSSKQLVRSYLKKDKNKARGVAQVVKHLPHKCESLNSNLSITKKKKEREKNTYLRS
jgi:hypothetical protein